MQDILDINTQHRTHLQNKNLQITTKKSDKTKENWAKDVNRHFMEEGTQMANKYMTKTLRGGW